MKSVIPKLVLGLVACAPLVAMMTSACGGKVAADGAGEPSPALSGAKTSVLSTAWPPCPADSAPSPLPSPADPEQLELCTQLCNRAFDCGRCTFPSCLPSCMSDALKSRKCGGPYVAWMKCTIEHQVEHACRVDPACDAAYCEYARCGAADSAPKPSQCH